MAARVKAISELLRASHESMTPEEITKQFSYAMTEDVSAILETLVVMGGRETRRRKGSMWLRKLMTFVVCLGFASGVGCNRDHATKGVSEGRTGSAAETWKYWQAFNESAVSGLGLEVFQKTNELKGASAEDIGNVFRDIAAAEEARCRAISSLSPLNVEPSLMTYALQFVEARTASASFLRECAAASDRERQVTSGDALAGEFFLSLLIHVNDGEQVFWNTLKEQASTTAANLQRTKVTGEALQGRAEAVRSQQINLYAQEMRARADLAQKFSREFPPMQEYLAKKVPPKEQPLSADQLKQDLLGRTLPGTGWTFDSLNEFVSFRVNDSTKKGEGQTDYDVRTHVKGQFLGTEYDFHLRMTYQRMLTRWKLVRVEPLR